MEKGENERKNNDKLIKEINSSIQRNENTPTIILGDFNAHIGYIGEQKENYNGKIFNKLIEDNCLILLNGLPDICEGKYTWSSKKYKSVIDFVVMNNEMFSYLIYMNIDEEKEKMDII